MDSEPAAGARAAAGQSPARDRTAMRQVTMNERLCRVLGRRPAPFLAAALALGLAAAAAPADMGKDPNTKEPAAPVGDPLPHGGWVRGAAFSPNGKFVVTGCYDGKVRLWSVPGGDLIKEFEMPYPVWSVAY